MNGGGNSYDDFRIDPLKLEVVRYLLSQGKNDSEIAVAMSIDRHTVAKVRERMNEGSKIRSSGRDEERRERVPTEEYQNILKMVKGLAKRVQELERWRNNGYVKAYNDLLGYVTETVVSRLETVEKRSEKLLGDLVSCREVIGDLQRDVDTFKKIWKERIMETQRKSEARFVERERERDREIQKTIDSMEDMKWREERKKILI